MRGSELDSYRPPEPARRRGGGKKGRRRRGGVDTGGDGAREMIMVPEAEFTSYYGHPVVKPPPWGHEVAAYLVLGGIAGGFLQHQDALSRALPGQMDGAGQSRRARAHDQDIRFESVGVHVHWTRHYPIPSRMEMHIRFPHGGKLFSTVWKTRFGGPK